MDGTYFRAPAWQATESLAADIHDLKRMSVNSTGTDSGVRVIAHAAARRRRRTSTNAINTAPTTTATVLNSASPAAVPKPTASTQRESNSHVKNPSDCNSAGRARHRCFLRHRQRDIDAIAAAGFEVIGIGRNTAWLTAPEGVTYLDLDLTSDETSTGAYAIDVLANR